MQPEQSCLVRGLSLYNKNTGHLICVPFVPCLWPGLAYHLVSSANSGLEPMAVLTKLQLVHQSSVPHLEAGKLSPEGTKGVKIPWDGFLL